MRIKLIVLILILLIPSVVQAISLGVVQKSNFVEVDPGNTVQFTMLLWNRESFSYPVTLEKKQVPDGWVVLIRPNDFVLDPSKRGPPYDEGEYIGLPDIGDIRTEPIKVYVNVPDSVEPGKYDVVVNMKAGSPTKGVSVMMEKNLKFTVEVKGSRPEESESAEPMTIINDTVDKITGKVLVAKEKENILFFVAIVLVVIFFLWLIRRLL